MVTIVKPEPLSLKVVLSKAKRYLKNITKEGEFKGDWTEEQERFFTNQSVIRMFAVMTMVGADELPLRKSPVFLHIHHDSENVIYAAAKVYKRESHGPILVNGSEGQAIDDPWPDGVPQVINGGFKYWRVALSQNGVAEKDILPTGPAYFTPDETNQLLEFAKNNKWESAIIIGNSYQMLRIALGTVQCMKKANFWLKCHFVIPKERNWSRIMRGSQKSGERRVFDQFLEEFERIPKYQIKGDLCTLQELINYLDWGRDLIKNNILPVNLLSESSEIETSWT